MIIDDDLNVGDLLAVFGAEESLSELDQAILDHALDEWSMGRLARDFGTTANALHRRKRELFLQFRAYLERRGITGSADIFQ